jgi:two-component system, chemotaxis family, chemotaxis protein CheY
MTTSPLSERILIADDDPVVRKILTSAVRKEGFTPVVFDDGRAAYRALQSDSNFRAAVVDMMMPHLPGLDLVRYMRTEKRLMRIPVMLITAEQDLRIMKNCFEAGVTMFQSKPLTTEKLQTSLRILFSSGCQTSQPA